MQGKKVSTPIVRISIISIALSVIVNLITIAVVTGFQQEVRQKISGFGSHLFIMGASDGSVYESDPIRIDQPFLSKLAEDKDIRSISPVAYKPLLFQSDPISVNYATAQGNDTTETHKQVHGAILKGVNEIYDWSFFQEHLVDGNLPNYSDPKNSAHILISQKLSQDLDFHVNDTVSAFFVRNNPVKRAFIVAGIYRTGLEEFDKKIVMGHLGVVQEFNDWGIQASISIADTLTDGQLIVKGDVTGGNGNYRYDWGQGYEAYSGFTICPIRDTTIRLIASDYWSDIREDIYQTSIPDTAFLKITIDGEPYSPCDIELNDLNEIDITYLDEHGFNYSVRASQKKLIFSSTPGEGSSGNYIGGFEIMLHDWNQLEEVLTRTKKQIDFIPTPFDELLKTTSIQENQRDIFVWLDFLDINVVIILSLMILIGIINMGSALLVLILIRSQFIGIMKAMGATNWSIRKIFLIQASFLIGRGLIWGNLIGVTLCLLQSHFGIIQLNPEVYYLSKVPIDLNILHWILLNVGTLLVCITALIIPSVVIARIQPAKSIKFN